jgi:hypothetical protein
METNQQNTPNASEPKVNFSDEVKNFYKGDFKEIFTTLFKNPIDGTFNIFKNPSNKAYLQSIILFSSVFVLYFGGGYLIVGEMREDIEVSHFIKISLIPVVLMFLISVASFGLKSISGKSDFKAELLTGGLAGIPIGLLVPTIFIIKMLASEDNIMSLLKNPEGVGVIGGLFLMYFQLMLINIVQQSSKASGTKDSLAWYLSPISILASEYFTYQIAVNNLF